MKIYFAYRSVYIPNNRFIKEFEADSILDFFQKNWAILHSDDYDKLLGTKVYGFPMFDEGNTGIDTQLVLPTGIRDLVKKLSNNVYHVDIRGNENCIEVLTDDDEVELAWYVFTEKFKQENWHKLAVWFCEDLPTKIYQYDQEFLTNYEDAYVFKLGKDIDKSTYLIANTIYDGANLSDIREIRIIGTDLPNLIKTLKNYEFKEDIGYGFDVLKLLQHIALSNNSLDDQVIFSEFVKFNLAELNFEKWQINNKPIRENDKSSLKVSDHLIEMSVNDVGEFYNYYVLFDNIWASNHPELAESLIYFGSYNHL